MKRILYFLITLTTILLLAYFIRYKTGNDTAYNIPSDAVAVVNINLRNLEEHLLFDAISHPFKYFSQSSTRKSLTPGFRDFYKSVRLGKNWAFYTLSNEYNTWYSDSGIIENTKIFVSYLLANKFEKKVIVKQKKPTIDVYSRGNIHFMVFKVFGKEKIFKLCYSSNHLSQIIDGVYNNGNVDENNNRFMYRHLLYTTNDMVLIDRNKNLITADFVQGGIDLKGDINSVLFQNTSMIADNALFQLDLKINQKSELFKTLNKRINRQKFAQIVQLDIDSIQSYWNGDFHFVLRDFIKQTDTVKTYEYDDDFNKIEKITIQENKLPDFALRLGTKKSIVPYLFAQNAVKKIANDTVFIAFPLAKTYVKADDTQLHLFVKSGFQENGTLSKLRIFFDINAYQEQSKGSGYRLKYALDPLKTLSVRIDTDNHLSGHLALSGTNNAFAQIFFIAKK